MGERKRSVLLQLVRAVGMLIHYGVRRDTWCRERSWMYAADGLISFNNSGFMEDERFLRAYMAGAGVAEDYNWHWRVSVGLWAARQAMLVDGDFVECGVNRGFLSRAIVEHVEWNDSGRTFHLVDTFAGLDQSKLATEEAQSGLYDGLYGDTYESVKRGFSGFERINIIKGSVPEVLNNACINSVAYLSVDMNSSEPAYGALSALWGKMSKGGVALCDDYGHRNCLREKARIDDFCRENGANALMLPTGQGIIIKA